MLRIVNTHDLPEESWSSPMGKWVFETGQPHPLINDSAEDLVVYVVADNPIGETCHYPDSGKWLVRSPETRILRLEPVPYFEGEE